MKMVTSVTLSALVIAFSSVNVLAAEGPHWDYSQDGAAGPGNWGKLSPDFVMCGTGKNQSPINLDGMIESDLAFIKLEYQPGGTEVVNNGHTIKVNYTPGNTLTVSGHSYELKQFHFHTPSENTIKGEYFPIEAHFVHADKDGNLAVVALMFRSGEENAELAKAWQVMPAEAGATAQCATPVDAAKMLPESKDYYRFNGSLTTPPCSEGVLWLVLKAAVTASPEQIKKFEEIMHHPNNRPVQPINARPILQ